jgi:ElaA protein
MEDGGQVAAYFRAFVKEPGVVQMGRALTVRRGVGLGGKLLKDGIEEIRAKFHSAKIYIEAQSYAVGFYAREGFRVTSEEFLEDGIPHVKMELVL